ncbi:Glycosyl hydrolases family 25 [Ralstonia sp. 25mfcol4.1]|uniref:glycoside hydrolase family 25 protein n=1 Tax=Ralstonia sp. 25mfcol4.1 TaxID=1761899 RepID=UPI00088EABE1|nr:glycoside hydrolase family 25 protein [Ralstonia sp. 25mfcol4.1]SDO90737.1 Glycosyl hydrolases family 25 [Ralstonia sp. 25mfcol4.1]
MPETLPGSIDVIIDIHHDNHFDAVKLRNAGVRAVIHKASEGATFKDPVYRERREQALAAGLLWGAYHFSSARPAADQAKNFLDATQAGDPDVDNRATLFCLDFEPSSSGPDMTLAQAHDFVARVRDKTGRWPMIYGGNMLRDAVQAHGADPILKNCPLWYARYRGEPIGIPMDTWPHFTLWQYTDGRLGPPPHAFAGMTATDRDCYLGTEAALKNAWPFADYFKTAPGANDQNG